MPIDSDDLERRDNEREANMERLEKLEAWHAERPGIDRLMLRIAALESRCHELEHGAVAAGVQEQIDNLQERVKALENQRPVKPEPELVYSYDSEPEPEQMWACELAETCLQAQCQSRTPHPLRDNCKQPCCSQPHDGGRCVPVPASPEVAIPDVPMAVGTERFLRELTGHMQALAQAYSWDAASLPVCGQDYLLHLAGVACTLRDAYDLARTGEHEAAQEKLEEIEW